MLFTVVLGAGLLLLQLRPGGAPPVDPDPQAVEGVVVEGRRESEAERQKAESDFVRELAEPTRRNRLARWNDGICPAVVGRSQRHGEFLAERIAVEARDVGLEVGRPGCKPDVLVVLTRQPEAVARGLREGDRNLFAHLDKRGTVESGGGQQSLDAFIQTPRPVRWWHVATQTGADGRPMKFIQVLPDPGSPVVPLIEGTGSSRLSSLTKEDLTRAVIIVDATRLAGVTYEALGSYLAMVALAQLDPEADPKGLATIMTLFKDRDAGVTPPETLTAYDRAYLKGLYAAPDNARSVHTQRGAIRRSLRQVSAPK